MCRIIACVSPDTLTTLLQSEAVDNLTEFKNLKTPEEAFDELWNNDEPADVVIIDHGDLDIKDVMTFSGSRPSTTMLLSSSITEALLSFDNVTIFESQSDLARALHAMKHRK